jgi:carbonic anhydrase
MRAGHDAMEKLIESIVEFRERMLPEYALRFKHLALKQKPDAPFIACSDSRVVPDLLASTYQVIFSRCGP